MCACVRARARACVCVCVLLSLYVCVFVWWWLDGGLISVPQQVHVLLDVGFIIRDGPSLRRRLGAGYGGAVRYLVYFSDI